MDRVNCHNITLKRIKKPNGLENVEKKDRMNYFLGMDLCIISEEILWQRFRNFVKEWKPKKWEEIPDCWQKQLWQFKKDHEHLWPANGWPATEADYIHYTDLERKILRAEREHLKNTVREYLCWRQWRERYPALLEKAAQGNFEANEKLNTIFTKKGHLRLHIHRGLKEYVRSWNEEIQWWLLEHRDQIPRWKMGHLIHEMEAMGFAPENSRETGNLQKGEDYYGQNFDRFTNRIRKMLNEMKIPTREGKRGRPRNN